MGPSAIEVTRASPMHDAITNTPSNRRVPSLFVHPQLLEDVGDQCVPGVHNSERRLRVVVPRVRVSAGGDEELDTLAAAVQVEDIVHVPHETEHDRLATVVANVHIRAV